MRFEKGQSGNPAGREITAAEACGLSKLVDHYVRALEAKDFEQRLNRLDIETPKGAGKSADAS
ncbi:MAG TPA: hypothetical protein VGN55_04740 [Xanthobacteraceae bacterium]|jgi:hypothetical protein